MDKKIKIYNTVCPRNCYSTCGITVEVEDGKIRRIEGNPQNLATANGPCLKGLSYFERQFSENRILTPIRKANGKFEKISWEEALNIISEKLHYLKSKYGPKSVLFYSGSGTKGILNGISEKFWEMYGGYTTTYGDLCWPSGLEATRLTLGENKHNAPWDLANSKLIIMWGKNPSETNIQQMVFIDQALENGAELIVIDPRRTQTSERASILIQPKPGTDGALALGIANIIIEKNLIDTDFIDKYVFGFDKFSEMVKEYPSKIVSEITDIPEKYIYEIVEKIGSIKPMTINSGFGMQRYSNSGQTMRAIIALLAITGNIGKKGASWVFANLQTQIFSDLKDPIAFYPPEEEGEKVRISVSVAKLGKDILESTNPPIKMIWVERGNPITSNPQTPLVQKAFKEMEFRVVVDQFLTDTAKEADIILPAKTLFEQSDIINAYWHPYLQWKQKIFDPPGEVKPETEIYYLLAKKMGFDEKEIESNLPSPNDESIEKYLSMRFERLKGITIEDLKQAPVLPRDYQEIAFSDFIFPTPSGKIELYSEQAENMWGKDPLPKYTPPIESIKNDEDGKYPFNLLTPNTKNRIHSQFNNLEMIREINPKPFVTINPKDAHDKKISDGDLVRVYNERGSIKIEAKVEYGIKPGCLSITNGWWKKDVSVNELSFGRETDMGFGAAFHDNLVQIEKWH